jgi:hypothetical protein
MLSTKGLSWGSCWIESDIRPHEDNFKELLGILKGKGMLLMIALGESVKWSPP